MRSRVQWLLALVSLLGAFSAHAVDFSNGCGSGANEPWVPDNPLGFAFSKACGAHDNCYSKCMEGGENDRRPEMCTKAEPEKSARRERCDAAFERQTAEICRNYVNMPLCRVLGKIYFIAVRLGGGGSFNGYEIRDLIGKFEANPALDLSALEKQLDVIVDKRVQIPNTKVRIQVDGAAVLPRLETRLGLPGRRGLPTEINPDFAKGLPKDFKKGALGGGARSGQ